MRTTLTLDDDVARKLKDEVRQSGKSFRETVNEYLRRGLNARSEVKGVPPFKVRARDLGSRPGLPYENIGDLLEQLEGPAHK